MVKSIVFVINTFSGLGGHYYSLVTTATALRDKYKVHIINLGEKSSPVIESTDIPYTHVYSNFRNQLSVTRKIVHIVKQQQAAVIHAFDQVSYMLSFHAAWRTKTPLVATKCGGPVKTNYPYINNLVVFTREDQQFFNTRINSSETQVALIPNRVIPFEQDTKRIASLRDELNLNGRRVILRIGRVDPFYYETAKQCINFTKALHKFDSSFVLVLIGNIVDTKTMEQMLHDAAGCDYIHFVTDRKYTLNAKELIDVAEIVVGTGRSFMEACSKGKKMMAPNIGNEYPVLVTSENFDDIFYYNFSERYKEKNNSNINEILNKLNDEELNSFRWFEHFFSYSMIEPLYSAFYSTLKPTRYCKIFKSTIKNLVSWWYHSFFKIN